MSHSGGLCWQYIHISTLLKKKRKKETYISYDQAYILVSLSKYKIFYIGDQDPLMKCVNFIFYSQIGVGKFCSPLSAQGVEMKS